MRGREIMNRNKTILIISFILVFALGFGSALVYKVGFKGAVSELDEEDTEKKIEDVNAFDEAEIEGLYDDMEAIFERCNPTREKKAIFKRVKCYRQKYKAPKYWTDIKRAERDVKEMLVNGKVKELGQYISCGASDLTWYEMHCESDRIVPEEADVGGLLKYVDKLGKDVLINAQWKRKKADRRKFRNPAWLIRSRLISEKFTLEEPWRSEPHPVEAGTIIMLEKKLDGNIYIAGVPVTGVPD